MKVVLGADSVGKPLLDVIAAHLARRPDLNVTDLSEPGLYADVAAKVAHALLAGEHERGILFCGTGIGVCISANKVAGIRAALTHDTYSAERAAKSNNAQIITMGARVIGSELAKAIVDTWLASNFDPAGSSAANVAAIDRLDSREARGLIGNGRRRNDGEPARPDAIGRLSARAAGLCPYTQRTCSTRATYTIYPRLTSTMLTREGGFCDEQRERASQQRAGASGTG